MDTMLHIDFETRSACNLKKLGTYWYAVDPTTEVLCMSYRFGLDGPIRTWRPDKGPLPEEVRRHVAIGGEVTAHKADFEWALWNGCLRRKIGPEIPRLELRQLVCTMVRCYAMALPGSLENAAAALGLTLRKDLEGRTLMMRMCQPLAYRASDGSPIWTSDVPSFTFLGKSITHEEGMTRLIQYCESDVAVECGVYERTVALSAYERKVWELDRVINNRGVPFDMPLVDAARMMRTQVLADLDAEMYEVTGGAVAACSNVRALKSFAGRFMDEDPETLNKRDVLELLDRPGIPEKLRRALELRREAGRAVSVAKLDAIHRLATPQGRVRGLYQYHGAGTGRWAGRDVQPHNFTRDLPKRAVVEDVQRLILEGNAVMLDLLHGPPISMISKTMRALVRAAPGKRLNGGDWSNVEGRGLAWLAGAEWKLEAFRAFDAGTGPDLYRLAYARTFGGTAETVTDDQRQIGKVMELSLGYGGGVGAFQAMAGTYGVKVPDAVADEAKQLWRLRHPEVIELWRALQRAVMTAVRRPGKSYAAGAPGRQVVFRRKGSFLWALLPSKRVLCYAYPEIRELEYGDSLTYMTVPSENDRARGHVVDDKNNSRAWARVGTFGGKLAENVTQAICRDILVDGMLRAEARGMRVIWHTHDDILTEDDGDRSAELEEIMKTPPAWAPDLPLAAECWSAERYTKG